MPKYRWEGPEGYTLVHPVTGAPVALEPGQEIDLPDHVAVSADLWTPAEPAPAGEPPAEEPPAEHVADGEPPADPAPTKPASKTTKKEANR